MADNIDHEVIMNDNDGAEISIFKEADHHTITPVKINYYEDHLDPKNFEKLGCEQSPSDMMNAS